MWELPFCGSILLLWSLEQSSTWLRSIHWETSWSCFHSIEERETLQSEVLRSHPCWQWRISSETAWECLSFLEKERLFSLVSVYMIFVGKDVTVDCSGEMTRITEESGEGLKCSYLFIEHFVSLLDLFLYVSTGHHGHFIFTDVFIDTRLLGSL